MGGHGRRGRDHHLDPRSGKLQRERSRHVMASRAADITGAMAISAAGGGSVSRLWQHRVVREREEHVEAAWREREPSDRDGLVALGIVVAVTAVSISVGLLAGAAVDPGRRPAGGGGRPGDLRGALRHPARGVAAAHERPVAARPRARLIDLSTSFTEPVAASGKVSIAPIILAIPFALYGFFLLRRRRGEQGETAPTDGARTAVPDTGSLRAASAK
jgi:hypothetical protein